MGKISLEISLNWENQDEFQELLKNVAEAQAAYEEAIKAVQDFEFDMRVSTEYGKG